MRTEDKLKIEIARLKGDFIGTLKGITWWDIPNELKDKLDKKIVELEQIQVWEEVDYNLGLGKERHGDQSNNSRQ